MEVRANQKLGATEKSVSKKRKSGQPYQVLLSPEKNAFGFDIGAVDDLAEWISIDWWG